MGDTGKCETLENDIYSNRNRNSDNDSNRNRRESSFPMRPCIPRSRLPDYKRSSDPGSDNDITITGNKN